MAIEIKNELRAAAIVGGADGGAALQLFGLAFTRTGVGVYSFTLDEAVDPGQVGIFCKAGINELAQPAGRFISPTVLEVRSYLPDGTPADLVVLFVEVHRYPGKAGVAFPAAPPVPTPGAGGGLLMGWGRCDGGAVLQAQSNNGIIDDVTPQGGGTFQWDLIAGLPPIAAATVTLTTTAGNVGADLLANPASLFVRTGASSIAHWVFFYSA